MREGGGREGGKAGGKWRSKEAAVHGVGEQLAALSTCVRTKQQIKAESGGKQSSSSRRSKEEEQRKEGKEEEEVHEEGS